jgi:large subunit ribosomal protein L29
MLDFKELEKLDLKDLNIKLCDLKKDHLSLRFQGVSDRIKNTSVLRKIRKDIARVKTAISLKAKKQ